MPEKDATCRFEIDTHCVPNLCAALALAEIMFQEDTKGVPILCAIFVFRRAGVRKWDTYEPEPLAQPPVSFLEILVTLLRGRRVSELGLACPDPPRDVILSLATASATPTSTDPIGSKDKSSRGDSFCASANMDTTGITTTQDAMPAEEMYPKNTTRESPRHATLSDCRKRPIFWRPGRPRRSSGLITHFVNRPALDGSGA